jgi:hypothetical protein
LKNLQLLFLRSALVGLSTWKIDSSLLQNINISNIFINVFTFFVCSFWLLVRNCLVSYSKCGGIYIFWSRLEILSLVLILKMMHKLIFVFIFHYFRVRSRNKTLCKIFRRTKSSFCFFLHVRVHVSYSWRRKSVPVRWRFLNACQKRVFELECWIFVPCIQNDPSFKFHRPQEGSLHETKDMYVDTPAPTQDTSCKSTISKN